MSLKIQIFAVYDKKAVAYNLPIFFHQKGQALRAFTDAVTDEQSPFHKHPEDYCLHHLGEFSDQTGIISPLTNPVPLEEALNCVKQK